MTNDKQDEGSSEEELNVSKKTRTMISAANEAAERIEKANAIMKENLDREESIRVEQRIAGNAEAGKPSERKEETSEEYADRILTGKAK